jgi:lipopolysaccharide export system protein LptC
MRMPAELAAALLALAALFAAGCGSAVPRDQAAVPPELRLEGVRYRVYRGEVLRSFGEADTASLRRDSSELRASRLEAVLPRSPTPVHITAPTGDGSLASQVFHASGGVVVSRGDDAARTERARYQPGQGGQDDLVLGDDPVAVTGRGYKLTGKGFTLDPAAGTIVVRGGARLLAGLAEEHLPAPPSPRGARPGRGP